MWERESGWTGERLLYRKTHTHTHTHTLEHDSPLHFHHNDMICTSVNLQCQFTSTSILTDTRIISMADLIHFFFLHVQWRPVIPKPVPGISRLAVSHEKLGAGLGTSSLGTRLRVWGSGSETKEQGYCHIPKLVLLPDHSARRVWYMQVSGTECTDQSNLTNFSCSPDILNFQRARVIGQVW